MTGEWRDPELPPEAEQDYAAAEPPGGWQGAAPAPDAPPAETFPTAAYVELAELVRSEGPANLTPAAYMERCVQDALGLGRITDAQAALIRANVHERRARGLAL